MVARKLLAAVVAVLAGLALAPAVRADDVLAAIQAKKVIKVGVKANYAPFSSQVDQNGVPSFVGLEPDLALAIGEKLGVKVEFVPVVSANRLELLKQGAIDLVIATLSVRPERKQVANLIEPYYYAGEQNVLAAKTSGLKDWKDLEGKPVCGVQGAYYNATVQQVGGKLISFKDTAEALAGLQADKCVAFIYDSTFFAGVLESPAWANFATPLPSVNPEPWALAVKKEDTTLTPLLAALVKEWHKSGKLIELEKKWHIPPSPFLVEEAKKAG